MKTKLPGETAQTFLLMLILLLLSSQVYAQDEPFQWKGDELEDINRITDNENDYRIIAEERDEMSQRPIDLNSSTEEEMKRIPFLNDFQRKNLGDYLKNYGEMFSMYELMAVKGFDSSLIIRIAPYIKFQSISHSPPLTLKNMLRYGRNQLIIRAGTSFPRSNGYNMPVLMGDTGGANIYPGNPYGITFRYTYSFGERLAIGFSGDKDPGEQFFKGEQKNGMDYYSGYLSFSAGKILKRLIIGNFRAGWGLGLTFNNGSSIGMYPGFIQEFSIGGGIRPTQTVSESSALRGIAISLGAGRFIINGIISYRKRDANVITTDSLSGSASSFSSFIETGYHRTVSELNKKRKIQEFLYGGNLNFRGNFFSLGISAYSVKLSANLQPRPDLYNLYAFSGSENFVMGADFNFFYRFIRCSGEVSRSGNGSVALLAGVNLCPDPRFSAVLVYRNYPPDFQNLYSNSFRQNSNCANENGWFLSLMSNLPWRLTLNIFADFVNYPWAKYLLNQSSSGNDLGCQLGWQLNKSLNLQLRCTYSASESEIAGISDIVRTNGRLFTGNMRFNINWVVKETLTLQSRVEIKKAGSNMQPANYGWLLFQDVCVKTLQSRMKFVFRYSVFDCPAYEARIYAYEPDMLYGYSMPSFYGKGSRVCLLLKYPIGRHLVFYVKSALTRYTSKDVISSGPDQINANWKLDISGQVQVRL